MMEEPEMEPEERQLTQAERKEARRKELLDALDTCKIDLSKDDLRLMSREVDKDFLEKEKRADALYRKKQLEQRLARGRPKRGNRHVSAATREKLVRDAARAARC